MDSSCFNVDSTDIQVGKELDLFLTSIYSINDVENDDELEYQGQNAEGMSYREPKRLKLSSSNAEDAKERKNTINFEKTRRLIMHLCGEGKYDIIYKTFEKAYTCVWEVNIKHINRHKFLNTIKNRKDEYDFNTKNLEIFILELIFDTEFQKETVEGGTMNCYIESLARIWCHHKRSTNIISNVYLYFDSMFKRFGRKIFKSENNYKGLVENANIFLKKIMFGKIDIVNTNFKDKLEIEKYEFENLPLCLIGALVSVFVNINMIRDKYFGREIDTNFGNEMYFFQLKKIFEMFIQLGIADYGVSKIYLNVMGRYYYERIRRHENTTEFKDYIEFLKRAVNLERSFLLTHINIRRCYFSDNEKDCTENESEHRDEQGDKKSRLNEDFGEISMSHSLLSFIRNDYWGADFPQSKKAKLGISCVDWNSYMENAELMLLEVLISDDIMSRFSKSSTNNENESFLKSLILSEDYSLIRFVYNLFKKKKNEERILNEMRVCIADIGVELAKELVRDDKVPEYYTYITTMRSIIDLYLKVERIWKESFNEDDKIRSMCINDTWTRIANYNDNISKDLMYGLSLFVYDILSLCNVEYGKLSELGMSKISRLNMDLLCWLNKTDQNNSMLKFVSKDCNNVINKYLRCAIFLFKCSNKKEHFQNYYQSLFSQRLINCYIPNRIGFGLNRNNIIDFYKNITATKRKGCDVISMISTQVNLFEIYFMFLLYNECGYSFINKFNFTIKDWYLSSSIFKFYMLSYLFEKDTNISNFLKDKENEEIDFSPYSKRIAKLSNRSSYIYDKINSWLRSEDLSTSETNGDTKGRNDDDFNSNEVEEALELVKDKVVSNINIDIPFSIIVLSSSNWPFSNKNDNFVDSELFTKYKSLNDDIALIYNEMSLYQQYYKSIYSRNLTWSYNMGICIIEYLPLNYDSNYCTETHTRESNLNIKLLLTLQQAVLLLCFNNSETVSISSNHYEMLKCNISRLFKRNKAIFLNKENKNKITVSSILNLEETTENQDNSGHDGEKDSKNHLNICLNKEFLNKDEINSIYIQANANSKNEKCDLSLLIDYASYYFADGGDNNCINLHTKQLSSYNYIDSFVAPEDDVMKSKDVDYLFGSSDVELDGIRTRICNVFKDNRYKIEAMIIKYIKFKKKSSFFEIKELVIKELFSINDNSLLSVGDQELDDKKYIIEDEISKCLDSLIQRDLVEISAGIDINKSSSSSSYFNNNSVEVSADTSRDQTMYCYVP